jgi:tRNA A37 N6-isopentenylltransferase MiaA
MAPEAEYRETERVFMSELSAGIFKHAIKQATAHNAKKRLRWIPAPMEIRLINAVQDSMSEEEWFAYLNSSERI